MIHIQEEIYSKHAVGINEDLMSSVIEFDIVYIRKRDGKRARPGWYRVSRDIAMRGPLDKKLLQRGVRVREVRMVDCEYFPEYPPGYVA